MTSEVRKKKTTDYLGFFFVLTPDSAIEANLAVQRYQAFGQDVEHLLSPRPGQAPM